MVGAVVGVDNFIREVIGEEIFVGAVVGEYIVVVAVPVGNIFLGGLVDEILLGALVGEDTFVGTSVKCILVGAVAGEDILVGEDIMVGVVDKQDILVRSMTGEYFMVGVVLKQSILVGAVVGEDLLTINQVGPAAEDSEYSNRESQTIEENVWWHDSNQVTQKYAKDTEVHRVARSMKEQQGDRNTLGCT